MSRPEKLSYEEQTARLAGLSAYFSGLGQTEARVEEDEEAVDLHCQVFRAAAPVGWR